MRSDAAWTLPAARSFCRASADVAGFRRRDLCYLERLISSIFE